MIGAGRNGDIPGCATVVVFVNPDVPEPHLGQIAYVVTETVTPDHVYELGPQPPEMLDEPAA